MGKAFIDTNVVVYANDRADPARQEKAIHLVSEAIRTGTGVVSTQVLLEYAAVATRKLAQDRDAVTRQLFVLERLEVIPVTGTTIRNALELAERYVISLWDATIITAAQTARCDTIWSEDLSDNQYYGGVVVRNPFSIQAPR